MSLSPNRYSQAARRAGLYAVPRRRVPLARHVPAGRTLHLIDIENLAGGLAGSCLLLRQVCEVYRELAGVGLDDHVIIAAGPTLVLDAGLAWKGAQLAQGFGRDGADRALLARISDINWVATHYDRVVVGSGDGIFAETLASLRRLGIAVGVVAPAHSVSWKLRRYAHFVRTFKCDAYRRGAA